MDRCSIPHSYHRQLCTSFFGGPHRRFLKQKLCHYLITGGAEEKEEIIPVKSVRWGDRWCSAMDTNLN